MDKGRFEPHIFGMTVLSGKTKPFAVLGHPVGHSLSPAMHNPALQAMSLDAAYMAFDVVPERVLEVLASMEVMGFGGVNLTVPHKEVAFAGFDRLDPSAQVMRAVNTVQFTSEGMVGHNTDGVGFLRAAEEAFGEGFRGSEVFVAGTGGAGRAVAIACAQAGASRVVLYNRTAAKAERLAEELDALGTGAAVSVTDQGCDAVSSDWVINGTSLGMKADDPPLLPAEAFRPGQRVMDLIYVKPVTPFMEPAIAAGAEAVNGLGMLLHQGVKALEIWLEREIPVEAMRAGLEEAVYGNG